MEIRRNFIGWDKPVTVRLSEVLEGRGPLGRDFSWFTLVVPTAAAGKQLINMLFQRLGGEDGAFNPPDLVTPAQLMRRLAGSDEHVASPALVAIAWKRVLEKVELSDFEALFPVPPKIDRGKWAMLTGQRLQRVRERLSEANLDMKAVSESAALKMEVERWQAMARLETLYRQFLAQQAQIDPEDWKREGKGVKAFIRSEQALHLAGLPTLMPLLKAHGEKLLASGVSLTVSIAAPETLADKFNDWGEIIPGYWEKREIESDLLENALVLRNRAIDYIDEVYALLDGYAGETGTVAVGSTDNDFTRMLVEKSIRHSSTIYDPGGVAVSDTEAGRFLKLVQQWLTSDSIEVLVEMLRHRWSAKLLQSAEIDPVVTAGILDDFRSEHFVTSRRGVFKIPLGSGRGITQLEQVIEMFDSVVKVVSDGDAFGDSVWRMIGGFCENLELEDASEKETIKAVSAIRDLLENWDSEFAGVQLTLSEHLELFNEAMLKARLYGERHQDDIPVNGWLELGWVVAPHLLLAGLADTAIPSDVRADAFLPETLCEALGIPNQEEREGEDAFLLQLLLHARRNYGKLDLMLWRNGMDGAPAVPSRFLFLSERNELAGRIKRLLPELPQSQLTGSPPGFSQLLTIAEPEPVEHISVTGFKAYLNCPFKFFLERLKRYQLWNGIPVEMDAAVFGSLVHGVLEDFNRDEKASDFVAENQIRDALRFHYEKRRRDSFGDDHNLAIGIQCDALWERLNRAVSIISRERAAGWFPHACELSIKDDNALRIGGLYLRGKIDLIEKHRESGALRVVDYKTSDKAVSPQKTHYKKLGKNAEPALAESVFTHAGVDYVWTDLQLPVYLWIVRQVYGSHGKCAYFNLGKVLSDIELSEWEMPWEMVEAGLRCAEAIAKRVRARVFWPPSSGHDRTDWVDWLTKDPTARIADGWLQKCESEVQS